MKEDQKVKCEEELQGSTIEMQRVYSPDQWVLVKLSGSEVPKPIYKVFAGWTGGFAQGDEWRLSSAIQKITKKSYGWKIENASGSIYRCHENSTGYTVYMKSVYAGWQFRKPEEFLLQEIAIDALMQEKPELFG